MVLVVGNGVFVGVTVGDGVTVGVIEPVFKQYVEVCAQIVPLLAREVW